MNFQKLKRAIEIFSKYEGITVYDLEPIPESFPNGAPKHSNSAYISVYTGNVQISEMDEAELKGLRWKVECEGDYFAFYGD